MPFNLNSLLKKASRSAAINIKEETALPVYQPEMLDKKDEIILPVYEPEILDKKEEIVKLEEYQSEDEPIINVVKHKKKKNIKRKIELNPLSDV